MSSQPTTTATTGATTETAATETTVESTVSAEWASYDTNKNDSLSRTEFNKWVSALQSAAGEKKPTKAYLTSAFSSADTDKSRGVSKAELTAFLGSK